MVVPKTETEALRWSCVIINYNGRQIIEGTVRSLENLDVPPTEFIIVDDGSTDGDLEFLRDGRPNLRIERMPQNTGRTSIVRNVGLKLAKERYVMISDNDITYAPNAVSALFDVLKTYDDAAACTPAVLYNDGTEDVCVYGHNMHYLCWSVARPKETLEDLQQKGPVRAVGCGIGLFDKGRMGHSGGFDENLVIGWGDDGELHHRLRVMGMACYAVPTAIVYHNRIRVVPRIYGMIHNRLVMLVTTYQKRTLLVLSPLLILFEAMLLVYVSLIGQVQAYTKAWKDVYKCRHSIFEARQKLRKLRKVGDGRAFSSGPLALPIKSGNPLVKMVIGFATFFLNTYWWLARLILR